MLCCLSEHEKSMKRIHNEIEKKLKKDRKEMYNLVKVLLLGAGESGKTTFIKQMRIIHKEKFSDQEKHGFRKLVFQNIFEAMQSMIKAMDKLNISYEHDENIDKADLVMGIDCTSIDTLKEPFLSAIKCLWSDSGIQECYNRRREYHLIDSAKYYLNKIELIGSPNFLPCFQDILQARAATSGIQQYEFNTEKFTIRMIDVGGQRSERRKWIHCFENVHLIIFLVAISEYDETLFESNTTSRMDESKALFQTIVNCEWFKESAFVMLLNKKDLLEEKIKYSHLVDYYPKYGDGPKGDVKAARQFILDMYLSLNNDKEKKIYSHFTCATDTSNIELVFVAVKDTITNKVMTDLNLS